jgi:hypothetical protein
MSKVHCSITGEKPDVSPENLQSIYENDMRDFEPIIKYYSANKCARDFADVLKTTVSAGKGDKNYKTSFLYAMGTSNFNDGLFESAIKTLSKDKKMLFDALSQKFEVPNYKESENGAPVIQENTIQLVARHTNNNRLKAVVESFDKEDPKDNEMLAELMVNINPSTVKKQCQELYCETLKRLATNCEHVSDYSSIKLIDQMLKADFIEDDEKEKLAKVKRWLLGHSEK